MMKLRRTTRKNRGSSAAWTAAWLLLGALVLPSHGAAASEYDPKLIHCQLRYSLSGWSFLYKTMTGDGIIRCDNGQQMEVRIESWAGGLSIGRSEIVGGSGRFTEVRSIADLTGIYMQMEAHAGVTSSGAANALTKGTVSLVFAGTGQGMDLGVTVGALAIRRK